MSSPVDGRRAFREGGQIIRRDGFVLRTEREAKLHIERVDSHSPVTILESEFRGVTPLELATVAIIAVLVGCLAFGVFP